MSGTRPMLIVLPALNEERSVAVVVKEVLGEVRDVDVLVVDDGSIDRTAALARDAGAEVISNPFTLGVGGAMRVGFRFAARRSYACVVQIDADGQHDPREVERLIGELDDTEEPRMVIGARFAGADAPEVKGPRRWAMRLLAFYLSRLTGTALTDVTSGFRAHNRAAIDLFARTYPAEYLMDTVESLVIVVRAGGRVSQVPVSMRARYAGTPSQSFWQSTAYLARVLFMLLLDIIRRWPVTGAARRNRDRRPHHRARERTDNHRGDRRVAEETTAP